tara:strand:+ start:3122 stop:3703 length:582 start_codon:yes stop_codon:yes gene_type:complete
MTATKTLNGLTPSRMRGSGANSTGSSVYNIASGYAANIFTGDIVVNTAGGNVNVQTAATDKALGVFVGCRYTAANGTPTWSPYWPTGTVSADAKAMVVDNPAATYLIQADTSVTIGDLNSFNFEVTLGAGSTVTGKSGFGLDAATRGLDNEMLRIVGLYDTPGNEITSAFPIVEVRLNQHVDAFVSAGPVVAA